MNKNKKILTVVMIVLSLIVAGSGGFILFKLLNNQQSNDKYDALASSYVSGSSTADKGTAPTEGSTVPAEPNPVDFPSLQSNENDEIYSWLVVPNTQVDYPVLQSNTDDNFYIDHGVDKEYRFAGAIYSQFCNQKDYSDRVTVLYGHNMADNSMFASLHDFEDADFFAANKDMIIYTPDKRLDYEIVAAYVYDDSHIMNSFDFSKDDVYKGFLDNVLHPHSIESHVREGATLDVNDRIVILSTCLNYGEGRWLVVGKLTGETPLGPHV